MIERLFRYQASPDYDAYTVSFAWHKKRREIRELFARAAASLAGSDLRLLDVGCGDGFDLFMLRRLPEAARFSRLAGVDTDAAAIEYCRARAAFEGAAQVDFRVRDVVGQPLGPEEPSDVIICSEVVEHLVEPERLIASLARALSAGGFLILSTPNGASWSGRLRRALGAAPPPAEPPGPTGSSHGHISVRGRKQWRAACRAAGLALVAERRGSLLYGSPAVDRRRWLAGLAIALDGLLDLLRLNDLSWETVQLYRREG
jgi:2-polyprenyl-3-methyl-5-hydroxy-6-metoxy-1,4-benzoquinol methylase